MMSPLAYQTPRGCAHLASTRQPSHLAQVRKPSCACTQLAVSLPLGHHRSAWQGNKHTAVSLTGSAVRIVTASMKENPQNVPESKVPRCPRPFSFLLRLRQGRLVKSSHRGQETLCYYAPGSANPRHVCHRHCGSTAKCSQR